MEPQIDDLGLSTVGRLYGHLQVDEEWTERRERGFRRWPSPQAQEIWSEPAFDDRGITVWRVHVRTELFRDFASRGLPSRSRR